MKNMALMPPLRARQSWPQVVGSVVQKISYELAIAANILSRRAFTLDAESSVFPSLVEFEGILHQLKYLIRLVLPVA